jgi:hypothetical protein
MKNTIALNFLIICLLCSCVSSEKENKSTFEATNYPNAKKNEKTDLKKKTPKKCSVKEKEEKQSPHNPLNIRKGAPENRGFKVMGGKVSPFKPYTINIKEGVREGDFDKLIKEKHSSADNLNEKTNIKEGAPENREFKKMGGKVSPFKPYTTNIRKGAPENREFKKMGGKVSPFKPYTINIKEGVRTEDTDKLIKEKHSSADNLNEKTNIKEGAPENREFKKMGGKVSPFKPYTINIKEGVREGDFDKLVKEKGTSADNLKEKTNIKEGAPEKRGFKNMGEKTYPEHPEDYK